MQKKYKVYGITCVATFILTTILLFSISILYGPYIDGGGLVKSGRYSSNKFGPNNSQSSFLKNYYVFSEGVKGYNKYYDVVVLGDSFASGMYATDTPLNFPNFINEELGLSVLVLHFNHSSVDDVLASEVFRKTPPKFFIYESIERMSLGHLEVMPLTYSDKSMQVESKAIHIPIKRSERSFSRKVDSFKKETLDLSVGASVLEKFFSKNKKNYIHRLNQNRLFSSKEQNLILLYDDDYLNKKRTVEKHQENMKSLGLYLTEMKSQIEKNQFTQFISMIIPDKSSAYKRFVPEFTGGNCIKSSELMATYGDFILPTDLFVDRAIDQGVQDFYRPDDTHWSYEGTEIISNALIDLMIELSNET